MAKIWAFVVIGKTFIPTFSCPRPQRFSSFHHVLLYLTKGLQQPKKKALSFIVEFSKIL